MSGARRLAAVLALLALLLPLGGCGKYGKPVRKSRSALHADARPTGSAQVWPGAPGSRSLRASELGATASKSSTRRPAAAQDPPREKKPGGR